MEELLGIVSDTYKYLHGAGAARPDALLLKKVLLLGLYKRFFPCEAAVHESTILSFPPPTCIAHPGAILLHDYWAVYDSPFELSFVYYTPYNIGTNNIV